jgi:hypothetical protein
MRRILAAGLVAASMGLAGCYHVTVTTGAPESATPAPLDIPWQHSFVYGLVPPKEINVAQHCPQGVAKVETEMSFLNGLASALTWSLYTPIHPRVTCASGPVRR